MQCNKQGKRCSHCIMPERAGHIRLNEHGVCAICEKQAPSHGQKEDFYDRTTEEEKLSILKQKVAQLKSAGKYDCVVSVSGGKDSIMTLYIAKEILHLNPLAIFVDNGFPLEEMYQNVRNATDILKVDLLIYKMADLLKLFPELIKSGKKIYYCRVCHALLDLAIREISKKNGVRLILGGYTKGQQYIKNSELFWIYEESDRNTIELIRKMPEFSQYEELFRNQMLYFNKHYPGIVQLSPFKYIKWEESDILSLIKEKLKFQLPDHSWPDRSTNCTFNFVSQYLVERDFGYAQHEVELSNQVRLGELSRQRALEIISTPIHGEDCLLPLNKMGLDLKDIGL